MAVAIATVRVDALKSSCDARSKLEQCSCKPAEAGGEEAARLLAAKKAAARQRQLEKFLEANQCVTQPPPADAPQVQAWLEEFLPTELEPGSRRIKNLEISKKNVL